MKIFNLCAAFVLLITSCANHHSEQKELNEEELAAKYAEVETRFLQNFLIEGQVISRRSDGSLLSEGDSRLFSSLAFGILNCEKSQLIFDAVEKSILARNGANVRFDPLPDEYIRNETSVDAEIGLLFGLVFRWYHCPNDKQRISEVWRVHREYTKDFSDLYPGRHLKMPEGFMYAFDLFSYTLGQRAEPHPDRYNGFIAEIETWTTATVAAHASCFRIHLSQLLILVVEKLGKSYNKTKFCWLNRSSRIVLTDWYCGTLAPNYWLNDYYYNVWEYSHQRCTTWEREDNRGKERPGLDFLFLYDISKR